jgi:hypothetical protein
MELTLNQITIIKRGLEMVGDLLQDPFNGKDIADIITKLDNIEPLKKVCPECMGYGWHDKYDYSETCYDCGGLGKVTIGGPADTAPQENTE